MKTLGIVLGVVLAIALLIIAGLLYRFKCRQMAIRAIRKEYKQTNGANFELIP